MRGDSGEERGNGQGDCLFGGLIRAERHSDLLQERLCLGVVLGRCRNLDLETEGLLDVGCWDFREHGVILQSNGVVSFAIHLGWESTEVTDAGENVADQAVNEFFHTLTAECDDCTNDAALRDFKVRDRLLASAEDGHLASHLLECIRDELLHFFSFHLRAVDTDVDDHFLHLWKSVDVLDLQLLFESSCDRATEPVMESCVSHRDYPPWER